MSDASLSVSIEEQVPNLLLGDTERVQQTLIIIIERALIQRPTIPISLSCTVIGRTSNLATILFSVAQCIDRSRSGHDRQFHDIDPENFPSDIPVELSLKIAKRIISECGGKLLIRPQDFYTHEVFFWVPMELSSTVSPG